MRSRRAVVVVVAAIGLGLGAAAPAGAGVPLPPGTEQYCARLVSLRDTTATVRSATTGPGVFAAIRKSAKEFRRIAADAPEMIADDMAVLATSISDLDRALRPLASAVRPARTEAALDRMLERIRQVIAGWAADQDTAAISEAQTAVDDWTEAGCGFRLSAGTASDTDTTTPTTAAPPDPGR